MKEFKILDVLKEYSKPILHIQFEGILDEGKLFNEVRLYYPEYSKAIIENHYPETEFRGLQNVGTLTLSLI